mmetsp:Transcript_31347/g.54496  ORF Transcript_31347/g.54496 Transcript_31347/m.54496 type:complete len:95 (-) Transcript_31347:120-404(-)
MELMRSSSQTHLLLRTLYSSNPPSTNDLKNSRTKNGFPFVFWNTMSDSGSQMRGNTNMASDIIVLRSFGFSPFKPSLVVGTPEELKLSMRGNMA